jgi:hypothetical protein
LRPRKLVAQFTANYSQLPRISGQHTKYYILIIFNFEASARHTAAQLVARQHAPHLQLPSSARSVISPRCWMLVALREAGALGVSRSLLARGRARAPPVAAGLRAALWQGSAVAVAAAAAGRRGTARATALTATSRRPSACACSRGSCTPAACLPSAPQAPLAQQRLAGGLGSSGRSTLAAPGCSSSRSSSSSSSSRATGITPRALSNATMQQQQQQQPSAAAQDSGAAGAAAGAGLAKVGGYRCSRPEGPPEGQRPWSSLTCGLTVMSVRGLVAVSSLSASAAMQFSVSA